MFNILLSSFINQDIPYTNLFHKSPNYTYLHVFGCLSTSCVFLDYPTNQKGYRFLDITTRKVIINRHVIFDETQVPFSTTLQGSPSLISYSTPTPPPALSPLLQQILILPLIPDEMEQPQVPPPQPVHILIPPATVPPHQVAAHHPMMTRSEHKITKQKKLISLHT